MRYHESILILLFLFIPGVYSCTSDPKPEPVKEDLKAGLFEGDYELVGAYRNDRHTTTLNGAFLKFNGQQLHTNMLGKEEQSSFKYANDTLYQAQSAFGKLDYLVSSETDTTLSLFTILRGVRFELEFVRKK